MDRFGGSVSNILYPIDGKIGGYWGLFGRILSLCVELILKIPWDGYGWLAHTPSATSELGRAQKNLFVICGVYRNNVLFGKNRGTGLVVYHLSSFACC